MPSTKVIANRRNDKVAAKKKKKDSEDEAYVAAKGVKEKKEKDPDAPKKPQTSYFLYMNANRDSVKKANPDLAFGPLTKKLTEMWKALTEEERKKYEELAAKDKERYHAEMEAKGLATKKKPAADADAPKKALSSFMLFSQEARERLKKSDPDVKQTDLLKKIGAQWKELSDADNKKWQEKAKSEKERYEREMKEYNGGKAGTEATAGTKRPAAKGTGVGSKKARKETQSDENEDEESDGDAQEEDGDDAEDDTKE